MRILAVAVVVIAVLVLRPPTASACSCSPQVACERMFFGSVFVGKAVSVKRDAKKSRQKTTFKVSEVFNGTVGKTAVVDTGTDDGSCGYTFAIGKEYLVYAHDDGGTLVTGSCTGTKPTAYAETADDLAYGRALPVRTKAVVDGRVDARTDGAYGKQRVAGATIRVLGTQITTTTNADGAFHLDLAPGTHTLEVVAADVINTDRDPIVVELPVAAACAKPQIEVVFNGRIAGKITDLFGKPAAGIHVGAVDAVGSLTGNFITTTKSDGTYEITGVMEGNYRVGVSLPGYGGPRVQASYPTTYYPGTPDEKKAKVVAIARGKRVAKVDFAIAGKLPVFRVSGTITSALGLPAASESVQIDVPGSFGTATTTDAQGRYDYDIVSGRELVVRVCNEGMKECSEVKRRVTAPTVIDLTVPR